MKPAVDTAKRLVVRPVDLAYVSAGRGEGAPPPVVVLGKDGAMLLLRFELSLPPGANVAEAYLVLHRAKVVDDDPAPISLHVTRIVEAWDGRSTSWARQPRLAETRAPVTTVEPFGPTLVRLDVRDLVRRWARRDPTDQGLAVVADQESPMGTTFALTAVGSERSPGTDLGFGPDRLRTAPSPDVEPYLELYLR